MEASTFELRPVTETVSPRTHRKPCRLAVASLAGAPCGHTYPSLLRSHVFERNSHLHGVCWVSAEVSYPLSPVFFLHTVLNHSEQQQPGKYPVHNS